MPGRDSRFTIYDALEKKGYFDANPANTYARDLTTGASLFKGAVEFPKMLYHPEGAERQTVAPEVLSTPLGPKEVGEQRELIWRIAETPAEEKALRVEGWYDHPAKAVRARVEAYIEKLAEQDELDEKTKTRLLASIPQMGSGQRLADLEKEIARLTEVLKLDGETRAADTAPGKK